MTEQEAARLRELVEAEPTSTLPELAARLSQEIGKVVLPQTVWNWLKRLGIGFTRRRKQKWQTVEPVSPPGASEGGNAEVRYREPTKPPGEEEGLQRYPSDLTDEEWLLLEPLLTNDDPRGRPREVDLRAVVNAIRYQARTGCQWRYLPHDFPRWDVVAKYYYRWLRRGVFDRINTALREQLRIKTGREAQPSAAIVDSQSVKTTEQGGERGYDAGKKIKGRKRFILVDVLGLILAVIVMAASTQDRDGAKNLFTPELKHEFPRMELVWADTAFAGQLEGVVQEQLGWRLEIVRRTSTAVGTWAAADVAPPQSHSQAGFQIQPHRWIVERTFGWIGRNRRLSKDYEHIEESSRAWVLIAMSSLMLRRSVA